MKEIKEHWQFYKKLKDCSFALIDSEEQLYKIHKQDDVKLQVLFTFEKDGTVTMGIGTEEIKKEELN